MGYVFYYCAPDGEHMRMKTIYGKTEKDCIEKAYVEFGKENIYCWCKE